MRLCVYCEGDNPRDGSPWCSDACSDADGDPTVFWLVASQGKVWDRTENTFVDTAPLRARPVKREVIARFRFMSEVDADEIIRVLNAEGHTATKKQYGNPTPT